ncbi:pre-mRNA-splicing factor Prp11p [[Candida] jaroonii]|uniref:Pre-mRNA-splicing factor Prp11p n=1 Tax=[Candida] jaroonii TaxID=467808 RepID=A0ACA9Y657_9ASCO|nr:pre-mRNA-splicing factor Prp11p [[Candida] jaroonii]
MDYSDRVNSKKGAGALADHHEANVHKRQRVKELLTSTILNLDNDPYVFKNHLGLLECKLCLTTHVNESSYISHVGGRKHQLNLERRRLLDDKNKVITKKGVSINNVNKRTWNKIGKPQFKIDKIRHDNNQLGLLLNVKCPKALKEPFFRFQNYFELTAKNQNIIKSSIDKFSQDKSSTDESNYLYLIISCEPYENICLIIPNKDIDGKVDEISEKFWWYWDNDLKEYYLQFLFK